MHKGQDQVNIVEVFFFFYTNGALDGACYIGGATLEQEHILIIPTEHWTEHVMLAERHLNNNIY